MPPASIYLQRPQGPQSSQQVWAKKKKKNHNKKKPIPEKKNHSFSKKNPLFDIITDLKRE